MFFLLAFTMHVAFTDLFIETSCLMSESFLWKCNNLKEALWWGLWSTFIEVCFSIWRQGFCAAWDSKEHYEPSLRDSHPRYLPISLIFSWKKSNFVCFFKQLIRLNCVIYSVSLNLCLDKVFTSTFLLFQFTEQITFTYFVPVWSYK